METMGWTPSQDALYMIVEVLQDSLVPDSEVQNRVQEKIADMQKHPDFLNYLLYILKSPHIYDEHVRTVSALLLKNSVSFTYPQLSPPTLTLIRQVTLQLLNDSSRNVRSAITTLIGTLVLKGNTVSWPELIPYLCNLLESSEGQLSETALMALFKICEEYLGKQGTEKEETNEAMNALVAKFVSLVTSNRENVRKDSIRLLNMALHDCSNAMQKHFDPKLYLGNLFIIAKDTDPEIQKLICQSFCIFLNQHPSLILPHINDVIKYYLLKTADEDDSVALQACEFWLQLSTVPNCKEMLLPYAERLLSLLLKNMRYSEFELEALSGCLGVDEHLEDKPDDIKPFSMRLKGEKVESEQLSYDEENGDEYEHDDAFGEPTVGWTLRKCSAASLDSLSLIFKEEMLPMFFPALNNALTSPDFLAKESGILALGAIADGCLCGLSSFLPKLLQFLLECLGSEQALMRVITCWTLSRYVAWLINNQHAQETFFVPVLTGLLKHFFDSNKKVQRAALSAFCILQEEAKLLLVPYINVIVQAFVECFQRYKFRSYLLLYDAIGVFANSVGNNLNKPEYVKQIVEPLVHRMSALNDLYDEHLFALLECLGHVAVATEDGFLPYSEVVFARCMKIISDVLVSVKAHCENPDQFDLPDKVTLCAAHDMMLAMAQGLKTHFSKLVTNSNLIQHLYYTLQDEMVEVRQPALALYGQLVKQCFAFLSPNLHDYILVVIENIDPRYDIACSNAAWVISQLCHAMGLAMEPYASQVLARFFDIMQNANGRKTMYQAISISLFTLALVCPEIVAPHLPSLLRPCCQAIRNVGDCEEKVVAFRGLCGLVIRNPAAVSGDFIYFCDAVASFNEVQFDLKEMVTSSLTAVRNQCGDSNWMKLYAQFPPTLQVQLQQLYGI